MSAPIDPLQITDRGDYLLVEFAGEFGVDTGKQCIDRMAEACERLARWKVLLDCRRMSGAMPLLARFEVAEYGASRRRELRKLALLNRAEVVLPDNFVENVATNRGMNMKVFTDFDAAEAWLLQAATDDKAQRDG